MFLALTVGSFCIAFVLSWSLNWLALIPWRRSVGKHWTERARLSYPVAKSASLNTWLIPLNLTLVCCYFFSGIQILVVAISAFLGAVFAGYFLSRELHPPLRFRLWLHLLAAGLLLIIPMWLLIVVTAFAMPDHFGLTTWIFATGVFLTILAFRFGLGLLILKWFGLLRPATDHLNALVAEASQKLGVPVRKSWILSTYVANAAAFPLERQLLFTDKLISILNDDEIQAVCAHELGHLDEPKVVLFIRLLGSFIFFPWIFCRPLLSLGDNGTATFGFLVIGIFVLWIVVIRVARSMEKRADKIVGDFQVDGAIYARALARLYESNGSPAVMSSLSTKIHPNLYDRMLAAGVTPDFPRPLPAKSQCWTSYFMWLCLILGLILPSVILCVKGTLDVWNAGMIRIH